MPLIAYQWPDTLPPAQISFGRYRDQDGQRSPYSMVQQTLRSGPSIVSAILPLTAGDYVELYGLQSTGTDAFWGNVAQTNFSACMIR